jgi:hypothetical protein
VQEQAVEDLATHRINCVFIKNATLGFILGVIQSSKAPALTPPLSFCGLDSTAKCLFLRHYLLENLFPAPGILP